MPGNTQHITVGSTQFTQIVAQTQCGEITVGEDPSVSGWPTTDFLVAKPSAANTPRRVSAGGTYTFSALGGRFMAGAIAGYVEAVSGATTFFQDEI
jgi:hypothetical protein